MKAAIIKGGKVVNIAKVADAEFAESQGWVVSETARIGDSYENGAFITTSKPDADPTPRTRDDLRNDLAEVHNRYLSGTTPHRDIDISIDVEARVNAQGTLAAVKAGAQPLPFQWFSGSDAIAVESEADMQAIHDAIFDALQKRFTAKGKVIAAIESISNPVAYNVEAAYHAHLRSQP